MKQTILTFITKVKPESVDELKSLLNEIGSNVEQNPYIPFNSLKRLHFASLVLHEDEDKGYSPYLVFENNFDGSLDEHLGELYEHAATNAPERARMIAYLRAHVQRPNAYHIGNVGRSVERIKQENRIRDDLENFLDGVVREGQRGETPTTIRQRIRTFMQSHPMSAWAAEVQPRQTAMERFLPWLKIVIAGLIALILLPVLIPLVIIWVIVLRSKEKSDPVQTDLGDKQHVSELVEREDRTHIVQNHMASITIVKPGFFRRATLWTVLWLVNLFARTANKGELSGIPSIHFAHWSMIYGGRRLLFVSNFDGSWENYLDDFIDKASTGLTAVWSNTVKFPRTSFLVREGARDGVRFKAVARDRQTYTNVWYSAYKDLTVQTIDSNSAIREQLFTSLDDGAARAWLWRF
jgi:hypothetical protein